MMSNVVTDPPRHVVWPTGHIGPIIVALNRRLIAFESPSVLFGRENAKLGAYWLGSSSAGR